MLTVVQVKLTTTPEVTSALQSTLKTCNREANRVSETAFRTGEKSRKTLQSVAYLELKAAGLSAQPALHVIRKVADAYTTFAANIRAGNLGKPGSKPRERVESKPITFRPEAAQSYDDRCLSWQLDAQTVSIWTIAGRMKNVPFACSPDALKTLQQCRKGETDLLMRGGAFYLIATCDIPEPHLFEPTGWIGVDLGITNIATTNTGYQAAGRGLNRHRERMQDLRGKLQKKGTKSAKRALKRISRKESRRVRGHQPRHLQAHRDRG
jgi:transposase